MNNFQTAMARKAHANAAPSNRNFEAGDLVQYVGKPFAEPGVVLAIHGRHGVDVAWVDAQGNKRVTKFLGSSLVQA